MFCVLSSFEWNSFLMFWGPGEVCLIPCLLKWGFWKPQWWQTPGAFLAFSVAWKIIFRPGANWMSAPSSISTPRTSRWSSSVSHFHSTWLERDLCGCEALDIGADECNNLCSAQCSVHVLHLLAPDITLTCMFKFSLLVLIWINIWYWNALLLGD